MFLNFLHYLSELRKRCANHGDEASTNFMAYELMSSSVLHYNNESFDQSNKEHRVNYDIPMSGEHIST